MALLGALCVALNTLGFTHRSLRAQVNHPFGTSYSTNQMSYDLARLRLNGLIERRPHTNTYQLTPTANGLRSSTPKSTTGYSDRCWSPTPRPHQQNYATA